MQVYSHKVALITGGSRGIGAATAVALSQQNYDIAITYRNKASRANEVLATVTGYGVAGLARPCDITQTNDVTHFFEDFKQWADHLDILVLNASGGMERDLVAADPHYPMHINRDAQLAFVDATLPLMHPGSTIVFVTSHWAYLYGQIQQIPAYEPVAESKHAGEQALRARQNEFETLGIRLLVVTGDLIEGTITPKLLERTAPGLIAHRRDTSGALPTATEMGEKIAQAAIDTNLSSGSTVVIGEPLETMLNSQ
ncbi:MAG TPA: short chain dehydrogenase [Ktedonobacter sp.]|nr:short chain dehydrogenase [Ktedonobacter sp.]